MTKLYIFLSILSNDFSMVFTVKLDIIINCFIVQ